MRKIPIAGPWITRKEIDYVADAAATAWYEDAGKWHTRFESAFAEYLGRRFAMALPSCTSAIHLALLARGIGPGDEVIVPEITWIATAAPVSYVGATPVFADVDERSWCLDAASFERAVTPRTRAVIPVDLYGNLPDMESLRRVADRHGLFFLEDAAEAAGAEQNGRRAGAFGDVGVFSFHGSKTLTTGEGGMLVTDDEALFRRAGVLRDHGRHPGDVSFFNREVAHKYKMSSMQAALGTAQLERIDELVARKREIFGWYAAGLGNIPGVVLNDEAPGTKNVYWMITAVFDEATGIRGASLAAFLAERGIDTRPFFHPLSSIPAYAGTGPARGASERNPVSHSISPRGINLPSALNLTRDDVHRVCDAIREALTAAAHEKG